MLEALCRQSSTSSRRKAIDRRPCLCPQLLPPAIASRPPRQATNADETATHPRPVDGLVPRLDGSRDVVEPRPMTLIAPSATIDASGTALRGPLATRALLSASRPQLWKHGQRLGMGVSRHCSPDLEAPPNGPSIEAWIFFQNRWPVRQPSLPSSDEGLLARIFDFARRAVAGVSGGPPGNLRVSLFS